MKKILFIIVLFISVMLNAQINNPNPKEQFQKGNISFSVIGCPSINIYSGNINGVSTLKPIGGNLSLLISYFPINNVSFSLGFAYKNVKFKNSIETKYIDNELTFAPYFSFFPFHAKKISFDIGWYLSYKTSKDLILNQSIKEIANGISYGFGFQHIFTKNLGVLNNHLGFQIYYHKIFNLKKVEEAKIFTFMDFNFGLIYHF